MSQYFSSFIKGMTTNSAPTMEHSEQLNLEGFVEPKDENTFMLHTKITPPLNGERKPVVIIIGVDVSGSMNTLACDVNETGGNAFTVLDLVKYTLQVIIGMFNENDTFAIVKYSDTASIILDPTHMDQSGKEKANKAVASLVTEGCTNIYDCLCKMNNIANKSEFENKNVVTVLLTDGVANISPPLGELKSYEMLKRRETLSTFGFGNNLNSKLLSELANVGNGSYAFIPDYSMVGTIFINFIASILASVHHNKMLQIKYSDGSITTHNTGIVQYGQSKDFVMMVNKQPIEISICGNLIKPTLTAISEAANLRFELLYKLYECIESNGDYNFVDLYNKYITSSDEKILAIMKDLTPEGVDEGQVAMALRYWKKWGNHYVRGYYNAQCNQFCMNFKDPGLQIYGGQLFHEIQEIGEDIFANLPAPTPTGRNPRSVSSNNTFASAPVQMSQAFYNQGGGCWAANSMVRMADNTFMPIEQIRGGMKVWTINNGIAIVEYAIVINTDIGKQVMCKLDNLIITPWHPVLINGVWQYPADITTIEEYSMSTVYNLILTKDHVIEIGGILSCTLGHMLKGNVIEHDYFGNKELILRDIQNQPGFHEKLPVFTNLKVEKNITTLKTIKWFDDIN